MLESYSEPGAFERVPMRYSDERKEAAHGLDLIKLVFHRRIGKVVEKLHAVDAQHHLQRIGAAPVLALGIVAGHLFLQLFPGDQLVHALQELLAAGLTLFVLVFGFGKADLAHGVTTFPVGDSGAIVANPRAFSEVP